MDRETRVRTITRLCGEHGCSEKVKKIHFEQFVDRLWHPHPTKEFTSWWAKHKDCQDTGIDPKRAWNCESYRQEYLGSREIGAA